MAGFQCRTHQFDVADAFESIISAADLVGAAFGHIDEMSDEIASDLGRIDEMRHAEALAPSLLLRIQIDADDHCSADEAKSLDDVQADAAETKHNAFGAGFDLCGIDHRADASSHAAADIADLVDGSALADFCNLDFGYFCQIIESLPTHVMVHLLAAD